MDFKYLALCLTMMVAAPLSSQNNTETFYRAWDTIFVPAPKGEWENDRTSIQTVFDDEFTAGQHL